MVIVDENRLDDALDFTLHPDVDQYLVSDGQLTEMYSDTHLQKAVLPDVQTKCLSKTQHDNNMEASRVNFSIVVAQLHAQATKPSLNRQASYAMAIIERGEASTSPKLAGSCATATLIGESCIVAGTSTMPQAVSRPQLQSRERPASARNMFAWTSPSTTQIAKPTQPGFAPTPVIDASATPIASKAGARGVPAKSARPVTRGARGQLAYDTQQLDPRTAQRLLGNRASAKLSQRRRFERVQRAEAALERCAAENAQLRVRLAEALGLLERLGHPAPPAALPATHRQGL